jgi:protein tyrosine phosphatase (PTP) superfamily phosphohydrolase (DUF442 family)
MISKARPKATNKKRAERPVSADIRRAARRAGIASALQPVDADAAISELREAFDEVFDAASFQCGGEHDALVLSALRRLRLVQGMLRGTVVEIGGAA